MVQSPVTVTTDPKSGDVVITLAGAAKAEGLPSKSGKMRLVATTSGFVAVPGTNLRLSLNLGHK